MMARESLPHKQQMTEGIQYVQRYLSQINPECIVDIDIIADECGKMLHEDGDCRLVTSHVFHTIKIEMKERDIVDDIDATKG